MPTARLCHRAPSGLLAGLALASVWLSTASNARAGEHPRVLIGHADVSRLRHMCGVGRPSAPQADWGQFGAAAADFRVLRAHFSGYLGEEPLPGELLAAAFLHVVDPDDPADVHRRKFVEGVLQHAGAGADPLELVIALEWCWDALEGAARREALLTLRKRVEPLATTDSPIDGRRFREKLAGLALALGVDEEDDPSPSWTELRTRLLAAARPYFTKTFPAFIAWRTLSPTGSASAPREESDTVLALELAAGLGERDVWAEQRPTVGRWLEHYLLEDPGPGGLGRGFLRADGDAAPLTPVPDWADLLPLTAHLLAARTRDPAAALVADRVASAMRATEEARGPGLWRWVPLVFRLDGVPRCDVARLPAARNLGGAVVLRGGSGADLTTIWINSGQPYLRRRQHFDAGHFLIRRGGELAVDGGDDVLLEATPGKRGEQKLGGEREPFDFEQYCVATTAHNCLVQWDAARAATWNQQRFLPVGGQRTIDGDCIDFTGEPANHGRATARQLAYGQQSGAAYLALDLAPAYDARYISAYTREFVFALGRALVIVDRVTPARAGRATWVLNVPARPQVDGRDLADSARSAGATNDGGIWRLDGPGWLYWAERDGGLWVRALRPAAQCLRVVGGPAARQVIHEGRHAGRTYMGGAADSFERLITPAERDKPRNAWYRLGTPTVLGPEFGRRPHWGRIEVEPAAAETNSMFVTVLLTDTATAAAVPRAALIEQGDAFAVQIEAGQERATVRLPAASAGGGTLAVAGPGSFSWNLPTKVLADEPLAVK
ncbi:MAG: hypothetical protein AB1716_03085 [Planctomycetota bacterium]